MSKKVLKKTPQSHEEICKIASSEFRMYAGFSDNPNQYSVTFWYNGKSKVGADKLNEILKAKIYVALGDKRKYKVTVTTSKRAKDGTRTIRVTAEAIK